MNNLTYFEPWWRFFIALLIGALIGLEREFIQQKEEIPEFAGIRTFPLIALFGALSTYLFENYGLLPFGAAFAGIILLMVSSHVGKQVKSKEDSGITTEVAALLVFLLGASVFWVDIAVSAALSVVVTLLLSIKKDLHRAIRRMKGRDLKLTLQFALISVVILPILPNQTIDPLGVINPFRIWLLVVFVSGIGFIGYLLMKFLDADTGIWLTGLVGGIVSSTATTLSFASRSKQNPEHSPQFAQGILLASAVMSLRVIIVVAVLLPSLLVVIGIPLAVMMLVSLIIVYILKRRFEQSGKEGKEIIKVENPLRLTTAIYFGGIFAVVLVLVDLANRYFGKIGVYLASSITGLTDVNPIMLSMSEFAKNNQLAIQVAGVSIVLAALTNTLSKGLIAGISGSKEMRPFIVYPFSFILASGIAALVLVILLGLGVS
jgi:uncharacterized membrane protein (DUF4010 family)